MISRRTFVDRMAAAGLGLGALGSASDTPRAELQEGGLAPEEFTGVRTAAYLNHAASSPLPRRSAAAVAKYLANRQEVHRLYQAGAQDYDANPLRAKLGRLLGAPVESLTFVPTTSDGIVAAVDGLDWRPGDNVVCPANDYPTTLYAALDLARRGAEVRQAPVREHLDLNALLGLIDGRTRAVIVSHVHWQTGHRIDLERLSAACRAAGALSVIDAIQSIGAIPIDLRKVPVDVLAAGGYKWLMGIPGAAVLYVAPERLPTIRPDRAGWMSMANSVFDQPAIAWKPDASRFQVGGQADPALVALDRSVDLLLEVGVAAIQRHVTGLLDRLLAGLLGTGLHCRSSLVPEHRSTLVCLTTGDQDRDDRLTRALVARGVIVAHRGPGIRVAPHLHNRPSDIDRFLNEAHALLRSI
jgi:selenocysteine lyase/cysteine desulfurase